MDVVIFENIFYGIYCREPQHCELALHILSPHMSERDYARYSKVVVDSIDEEERIYTFDYQLDKIITVEQIIELLSPFFDNVVCVKRYIDVENFFINKVDYEYCD